MLLRSLSSGNVAGPALRCFHDFKLEFPQFGHVLSRDLTQKRIAFARQMDFDEAAILFALNFSHQSAFFCALDEPHHGIVPSLQELREFRNSGPTTARVSLDPQQELMLLWSDSTSTGYSLTEAKKAANAVAKPCQLPQCVRVKRRDFRQEGLMFHKINYITM
jgi:hypothetical protein